MACDICGVECDHGRIGPGLTIRKVDKDTKMYTLTEDLDMDATQTRAVPAGSPESRYVLGVRGSQIPDEMAVRLGLKQPDSEAPKMPSAGPFARLGLAEGEALNGRNVRMVNGSPVLAAAVYAQEDAKVEEAKAPEEAEVVTEEVTEPVEKAVEKPEVADKAVTPTVKK